MATLSNTPFSIDRKIVQLVKPSKPTPSEVLSLSSIDNDTILENLWQSIYVYKANDNVSAAHKGQADPASILAEALSKVLVYYFPLAGKLRRHSDGKLRLKCNADDGVPFVVATANCQLSSVNYLDKINTENGRHFVCDFPSDSDHGYHPLALQVTKFSCGGFTIGMSLSHSVCDGFGAAQFFRALVELASGKSEPSVKPVWERERLVGNPTQEPFDVPVDKNSLATSPYLPTSDVVHEYFDVSAKSIAKLKMSLMEEANQGHDTIERMTTFEILGAYVWRSRFRALKMDSNGNCCLHVAVGLRNLMEPPLPEGYYGNAFISANVVLPARDLEKGSLTKVVKFIKQNKNLALSNDYIRTFLGDMEKFPELNAKMKTGASMELTDWRHLGLLEGIDFGWKPVNLLPVPISNVPLFKELCMLMPPPKLGDIAMKSGDVRVFVSLPRAAMPKFKEEMDALMYGVDAAST
ncbi:hypothetical protein SLE2022_188280 [Rubroshorea leprosula]